MIRAWLYVVAAGIVWFVEGFLFSRFLQMSAVQTVVLFVLYAGLFSAAVWALMRSMRDQGPGEGALWRQLALAPMAVAIVGSFLSLPLVLLVAILGKVL